MTAQAAKRIMREDMPTRLINPRDVGMADIDFMIRLNCCKTFDEADKVLEHYIGATDDESKIKFLTNNFDVKVLFREGEGTHIDYVALLTSVVKYSY